MKKSDLLFSMGKKQDSTCFFATCSVVLTHRSSLHNYSKMATVPVKQRYTCISCQVAFANPEHQRAHFKTDWHRYNLKRKVAELPSVTATVFQEKVVAQKMADANERDSKLSQYCKTCHKTFANKKSLQSHERSRKHKEMVEKVGNTSNSSPLEDVSKKQEHKTAVDDDTVTEVTEEIEADENEPLETTECLFCPHYESNMEANIAHMSKVHGFFIPDLEFLVDLEGLVKYLGEKVGVANMCIYCNEKGKQFYSIEAVQHHMTEKGHCKIMFEGDYALEFADHYDYTKSYPDKEIGNTTSEELPIPDHSLTVNNDLELVLPSGVLIGHRYLKNYYKQNVPVKERKKGATVSRVNRVMAQYRSLGWSGLCEANGKKGRDEKWAHKMRQQRSLNISVKANKFQTYLRPQVVF